MTGRAEPRAGSRAIVAPRSTSRRPAVAWPLLGALVAACTPLPEPTLVPAPAMQQIVGRLVLLGDGGAPDAGSEPVLLAARSLLAPFAGRATLVLLGDNVYPRGIPDSTHPEHTEMVRRLRDQLRAGLDAGADVIAVPGNHDWDKSGPDGWTRIRRQAALAAAEDPRARLLPSDGCPGPVVTPTASGLRLAALDTQWFLHDHAKPVEPCAVRDLAALGGALREALAADTAATLVIAHHPLRSRGVHGGHFTWKEHLFPLRELNKALWIPLPLIGSLYPIIRGGGISPQDIPNGRNRALADTVRAALHDGRPLAYASGHEHNLQVLEDPTAGVLLVSGAGYFGHESAVGGADILRFGSQKSGGMVVDRLADGRVRLGVFLADRAGTAREVYSRWLR